MKNNLLDFIVRHTNDEWNRLLREFSKFSPEEFTWQPGRRIHSIGWHVRHAIEWRYVLVHVFVCGRPKQERLLCLGWERDALIQSVSDNHGWYEPSCTVEEDVAFLGRVRETTNSDLQALPVARYWEPLSFPWRANLALDEIFQDVRHSALHRGHIREISKMYARRSSTDFVEHPTIDLSPAIEGPDWTCNEWQCSR